MIKFIIDIFCNDTIIGLSQFENENSPIILHNRLFKNNYASFFSENTSKSEFIERFTDPIAYHL